MNTIKWEKFSTFLVYEEGWKENKVEGYWIYIFNICKSYFKETQYTGETLQMFFRYLQKEKKISNTTCNNYRKFFAKVDKYLGVSALSKIRRFKDDPVKFDILSPAEIDILIKTRIKRQRKEEELYVRYSVLIEVMAKYALRVHEAINMKWEHLQEDYIEIHSDKTNRIDQFILNPELKKRIDLLPRYDHGYIFGSESGPLIDKKFNYELQKRCQQAGIKKKVTSHTFRRSFATQAIKDKVQRDYVQEYMRHSSSSSLDKYVQKAMVNIQEVQSKHSFFRKEITFNTVRDEAMIFIDWITKSPFPVSFEENENGIEVHILKKGMVK